MKNLIFLMFLISTSIFARNGQGGNGGGIHYCPESSKKAEFYDLYEGREIYDLPIPKRIGSRDLILKNIINKIFKTKPVLANLISDQLVYIKKNIKFVQNKKLSPVDDADTVMVDYGCSYEQLANWHDLSGKIFVQKKMFDLLERPIDQAAFFLHEAVYKVSRRTENAPNSNVVRKFVAEAFSDLPIIITDVAPRAYTYPGISYVKENQIIAHSSTSPNLIMNQGEITSELMLRFANRDCHKKGKMFISAKDLDQGTKMQIILHHQGKNHSIKSIQTGTQNDTISLPLHQLFTITKEEIMMDSHVGYVNVSFRCEEYDEEYSFKLEASSLGSTFLLY